MAETILIRAVLIICNGNSHGYFTGEKDGFHEPLLYVSKDW